MQIETTLSLNKFKDVVFIDTFIKGSRFEVLVEEIKVSI